MTDQYPDCAKCGRAMDAWGCPDCLGWKDRDVPCVVCFGPISPPCVLICASCKRARR